MRFLIDAQLPALMCEILEKAGFESFHVESLPEGDESSDKEIAKYADKHGLILITKDLDFHYSNMIIGQPGRLLLITTGNIGYSGSNHATYFGQAVPVISVQTVPVIPVYADRFELCQRE